MQSRREFLLAAFATGAVLTAEGLWIPGRKLISIPKKHLILDHGLISIVDSATGRVLCSLPRTMDAVDIQGGVAKMTFPQIRRGVGIARGLYAGKTRIADFDCPIAVSEGMTLEVTVDRITEVVYGCGDTDLPHGSDKAGRRNSVVKVSI